jgi:DNA-binding CsgD family transcriptional regulator
MGMRDLFVCLPDVAFLAVGDKSRAIGNCRSQSSIEMRSLQTAIIGSCVSRFDPTPARECQGEPPGWADVTRSNLGSESLDEPLVRSLGFRVTRPRTPRTDTSLSDPPFSPGQSACLGFRVVDGDTKGATRLPADRAQTAHYHAFQLGIPLTRPAGRVRSVFGMTITSTPTPPAPTYSWVGQRVRYDDCGDGLLDGSAGAPGGSAPNDAEVPASQRAVTACPATEYFNGPRHLLAHTSADDGRDTSLPNVGLVEQLALWITFYEGALDDVRQACNLTIGIDRWQRDTGAGTVATAHATLAVIELEQGWLEEASRQLPSIGQLAPSADGTTSRDVVTTGDALHHEESSHTDRALRALGLLVYGPAVWAEALLMGPSIVPVVGVAVAAGNGTLASRLVACVHGVAREHANPSGIDATTDQAKAQLLGDPAILVEAALTLASFAQRIAKAVAAGDAALAMARSGEDDRAVSLAHEAVTLYTECALTPAGQRVRKWLRAHRINLKPYPRPARPSFGWDALSDKELHLAELVAEGLTNRQISQRLYLSPHTVDSHLRHIFAKLSINSRVLLSRTYLEHLADRG